MSDTDHSPDATDTPPCPAIGGMEDRLRYIIDELELNEAQKRYLLWRWLDSWQWYSLHATRNLKAFWIVRAVAIVGGVSVPALVALDVGGSGEATMRWLTFGLSLLVAVAVAIEGFFRFGEKWRLWRRYAQTLLTEGWHYFELTGIYADPLQTLEPLSHSNMFKQFVDRIEGLAVAESGEWLEKIATEKEARPGPNRWGA